MPKCEQCGGAKRLRVSVTKGGLRLVPSGEKRPAHIGEWFVRPEDGRPERLVWGMTGDLTILQPLPAPAEPEAPHTWSGWFAQPNGSEPSEDGDMRRCTVEGCDARELRGAHVYASDAGQPCPFRYGLPAPAPDSTDEPAAPDALAVMRAAKDYWLAEATHYQAEAEFLRDGLAPLADHPTAGGIVRALLAAAPVAPGDASSHPS